MKKLITLILILLMVPSVYAAENLLTYTAPALNANVAPIVVNQEGLSASWYKHGDTWTEYTSDKFTKGEYRINLTGGAPVLESDLTWTKDNDNLYHSSSFFVGTPITLNVKVGENKAPDDLSFKVKDKSSTYTVVTKDGKLSFDALDEADKYEYTFAGSADVLPANGSAANNATITLTERPGVTTQDFFVKTAQRGYIKGSGTYTLVANNCKLSLTQTGEGSDEINVQINSSGLITTDFYVIKNGTASKKAKNITIPVDNTAPVIQSCETEPGDDQTFVKQHGIYGKTTAALILHADIIDDGCGIEKVYLVAGEKQYDPIETEDGYTIAINEAGLKEQTFYIVAEDKLGNKSEEALIRKGNAQGSQITLETVSPQANLVLVGETTILNGIGWFYEDPWVDLTIADNDSGIASYKVFLDNNVVDQKEYQTKETEEIVVQKKVTVTDTPTGAHQYKAEIKDNAGNMTTKIWDNAYVNTNTPTLDILNVESKHYQEIPTIIIRENTPFYQTVAKPDVEVTFHPSIEVTVTKDGEAHRTKTVTDEKEMVLPASWFEEDGVYAITANATDASGKTSRASLDNIVRDKTGPVNTLDISGTGWRTDYPTASYSAIDHLSTVSSTKLYLDGELVAQSGTAYKFRSIKDTEEGVHIVKFVSQDSVGNISETEKTFQFDNVTPEVSISSVDNYRKTNPSVKVSVEDNFPKLDGNKLNVKITRNGSTVYDETTKGGLSIPSGTFDKDGKYVITANDTDQAGNKAKEKSVSFVKDATKPKVSISGVKNNANYNKSVNVKIAVNDENLDTVSVTVKRTLEGKTTNVPWNWKTAKSKTFSTTGTYSITVSAKDKAGNDSGNQTIKFTVDKQAPVITISGVTEGKIYTKKDNIKPVVTIKDPYLKNKNGTITKKSGKTNISLNASKAGYTCSQFTEKRENDGTYTIKVTASDKAGNTATKFVSFTVNKFGSTYKIKEKPAQKVMRVADSPVVIVATNPSKIKSYEAKIIHDAQTTEAKGVTTSQKDDDTTYTISANNFDADGTYRVNLITKDEAGNVSESRDTDDFWFTIDTVPPNITYSGIEAGETYKEEAHRFNVSATDSVSDNVKIEVTADGSKLEVDENGVVTVRGGYDQKIVITATDEAGNNATQEIDKVSVSTSKLAAVHTHKGLFIAIAVALAGLLAFIIVKLVKGARDGSEE